MARCRDDQLCGIRAALQEAAKRKQAAKIAAANARTDLEALVVEARRLGLSYDKIAREVFRATHGRAPRLREREREVNNLRQLHHRVTARNGNLHLPPFSECPSMSPSTGTKEASMYDPNKNPHPYRRVTERTTEDFFPPPCDHEYEPLPSSAPPVSPPAFEPGEPLPGEED